MLSLEKQKIARVFKKIPQRFFFLKPNIELKKHWKRKMEVELPLAMMETQRLNTIILLLLLVMRNRNLY